MSDKLSFIVPLVPPGVNHYVRHYRNGAHRVTEEALAFKSALAIYAAGRTVKAKRFAVTILVVKGKKDRGDVDNYPKLVLDGLATAGVFLTPKGERSSDAHVHKLVVAMDGDLRPERGQTEITVEALGGGLEDR